MQSYINLTVQPYNAILSMQSYILINCVNVPSFEKAQKGNTESSRKENETGPLTGPIYLYYPTSPNFPISYLT